MMQFAEIFPDEQIVATLSRQLFGSLVKPIHLRNPRLPTEKLRCGGQVRSCG